MFVNGKQNCFITLKDHKPNFQNNPTVRLLKPAKNELGRIIKTILGKINVNLRKSLHLNQWKNTQEVIDWFKGIDNKQCYKFIMFDIKDFYPSISKELLTDAQYDTKNVGLYRDDGLSIFKNYSGPQMEKIKNHLERNMSVT